MAYQSKDYGARSPVLDVAIGLLLHGLDLHLLVRMGKQEPAPKPEAKGEEYER